MLGKRAGLGLGVACLMILVACGDDSGGGSRGPTLDELGTELTSALCKEIASCTGDDFLSLSLGGMDCEDTFGAQLEDDGFAQLKPAIDAKRVSYHADKADACLASIENLGCGVSAQRLSTIAGCEDVFEGTIAVGKDCDVDEACTGDAFCKRAGMCPGTCTQRGDVGETCEKDDQCQNGLTCSDDGACEQPGDENDACGGGKAPGCGLGLICQGASDTTGTTGKCAKLTAAFAKKDGETCSLDTTELCEPALSCVAAIANGKATFSCAKKVAPGAACKFGIPTQCPDGEYCDADITAGKVDGTCQKLPAAGEGCRKASFGQPGCAPGLICGGDDTCRKVGRIGDACTADADCASTHCEASKCATDLCEL